MASDESGAGGAMQIDTDLVRQLAELLNSGDLSEIEVQDGERRIVVKRQLATSYLAAPAAVPAAPAPLAPVTAPAALTAAQEEVAAANHPGAVKSPMVGTVFLSGEPGAPPFVSIGQQVSARQTLVIVEAMKVMNPITAPKAGIVRQILVVDAQPVEYDQPLVIVE